MPAVHLHHSNQPILFTSVTKNSPPITTLFSNRIYPKSHPTGPVHLVKNRRTTGRSMTITCMANPRRLKMVAKQIQTELSDMLLTDKVLQYAVLPEAALVADRGREVALAGLKSKAKYVRSELGRRMKLRLTPEIRFIEDESLERGSRVIAILDQIKVEKDTVEYEDDDLSEPYSSSRWNKEWEGDDPDEDIIYVK